ncbi:Glutamyl-tRNA reductase [Gossypium arboreum]|uniref:Glutamyl-tRNA reductase n=1 Tax=Gossypium arboreum TaxID=29729 RepID=A0A0B0NA30_GOSAR|nr:Glutamyl-tRNA reductase [Gossypium arboreum]
MPRRRLQDLSIIQNPPNSKETNSDQQTTIGSSNVPNTIDESVEIQRHTLLKDLYDLNFVERVKVSRNSHGQPIGSEARLLAGYLGIIARNANLLSINYKSWHYMSDSNKNQALNNIKERYALEVSDNYVKKALGKKWRDHKSDDEEKSKDKREEYEAIASSDSSVNLDNIDNRIITEVLGPESLQQYMPLANQA